MITFDEFKGIDIEVNTAIDELLDYIELKSKDYILLLANGEFHSSLLSSSLNPHVIDYHGDRWRDEDRFKFFSLYMDQHYSFPGKSSVISDSISIQLELMLYTHIWESKPFLKRLFRLASLAINNSYPWDVEVPKYKKEDYVRKVIRKAFEDKGLAIGKVIKDGFHTSLRNAFAHSDYSISYSNKRIDLHNYGGMGWELEKISFQAWAKRFAYTALISYNLHVKLHEKRTSLLKKYGTNEFVIVLPKTAKSFIATKIYYHGDNDSFNFR